MGKPPKMAVFLVIRIDFFEVLWYNDYEYDAAGLKIDRKSAAQKNYNMLLRTVYQ